MLITQSNTCIQGIKWCTPHPLCIAIDFYVVDPAFLHLLVNNAQQGSDANVRCLSLVDLFSDFGFGFPIVDLVFLFTLWSQRFFDIG